MGPGCGSEEDSASSPTLTSLLQDKEPHSIESKKSAVESGCPVTYKLNDFDGVPLTSPNHDFFFPEMRTAWIGVLAKVPGRAVCVQSWISGSTGTTFGGDLYPVPRPQQGTSIHHFQFPGQTLCTIPVTQGEEQRQDLLSA